MAVEVVEPAGNISYADEAEKMQNLAAGPAAHEPAANDH